MNTNSNGYTFAYASGLVILVAALLAVVALVLKPYQDANIKIEKKQNILASVGLQVSPEQADAEYAKIIKDDFVVDNQGQRKAEIKGFDVDLVVEVAKSVDQRSLPIFKAEIEGSVKTIIPVRGKGLWGPIWGYVALEPDMNTIYGTSFDHKGETPGLGADINLPFFEDQFKGKKLFDGETYKMLVYKGGKGSAAAAGDLEHGVDAISGGTITSKGLEAMLRDCLLPYQSYFKNTKN